MARGLARGWRGGCLEGCVEDGERGGEMGCERAHEKKGKGRANDEGVHIISTRVYVDINMAIATRCDTHYITPHNASAV